MQVFGEYQARYQPLVDTLVRQVDQYRGGGAVTVYKDTEKVVDIWTGHRDHLGTPWLEDTIAMVFSTTKGVLMTALHMLESRGLIDYDQPVADFWPEFAEKGKHRITIRQLASHQAGLYKIPQTEGGFSDALDWDPMAEALAKSRPDHRPGKHSGYHAITIAWLVGELVRRVSGKDIQTFVKTEIAEPLELDGLYVGVPRSELHRIAPLRIPPDFRFLNRRQDSGKKRQLNLVQKRLAKRARHPIRRQWRSFYSKGIARVFFHDEYHETPIPSANGHFTARSLAKMYAALANNGNLGGVELVKPATLDRATTLQFGGFDRVIGVPLGWMIGYHRAGTDHAFGHFGMGGSGGWACRKHNIAAAMVHNSNPFGLTGQARMVGINLAIYKSLSNTGGGQELITLPQPACSTMAEAG